MCVCSCKCACMGVPVKPKALLSWFLRSHTPCFSGGRLSLRPGAHHLAKLARQRVPRSICLSLPQYFDFFFPLSFVCLFVFPDNGFSVALGYSITHPVHQAGFEFRELPASAPKVLGLKAFATTTQQVLQIFNVI